MKIKDELGNIILVPKGYEEKVRKLILGDDTAELEILIKKFGGGTPKYQKGGVNTTGYTPGTDTYNNSYNVIPGGDITMRNTPFPVMGYPLGSNVGQPVLMKPGRDYKFKGAQAVLEIPAFQFGGMDPTAEYTTLPNEAILAANETGTIGPSNPIDLYAWPQDTTGLFGPYPQSGLDFNLEEAGIDPNSGYWLPQVTVMPDDSGAVPAAGGDGSAGATGGAGTTTTPGAGGAADGTGTTTPVTVGGAAAGTGAGGAGAAGAGAAGTTGGASAGAAGTDGGAAGAAGGAAAGTTTTTTQPAGPSAGMAAMEDLKRQYENYLNNAEDKNSAEYQKALQDYKQLDADLKRNLGMQYASSVLGTMMQTPYSRATYLEPGFADAQRRARRVPQALIEAQRAESESALTGMARQLAMSGANPSQISSMLAPYYRESVRQQNDLAIKAYQQNAAADADYYSFLTELQNKNIGEEVANRNAVMQAQNKQIGQIADSTTSMFKNLANLRASQTEMEREASKSYLNNLFQLAGERLGMTSAVMENMLKQNEQDEKARQFNEMLAIEANRGKAEREAAEARKAAATPLPQIALPMKDGVQPLKPPTVRMPAMPYMPAVLGSSGPKNLPYMPSPSSTGPTRAPGAPPTTSSTVPTAPAAPVQPITLPTLRVSPDGSTTPTPPITRSFTVTDKGSKSTPSTTTTPKKGAPTYGQAKPLNALPAGEAKNTLNSLSTEDRRQIDNEVFDYLKYIRTKDNKMYPIRPNASENKTIQKQLEQGTLIKDPKTKMIFPAKITNTKGQVIWEYNNPKYPSLEQLVGLLRMRDPARFKEITGGN